MLMSAKVKFLNRSEKQGIKDPTKVYYRALLYQGTSAPDFDCSKEAYEQLSDVPEMSEVVADFEYNAQYGSVKVVGFHKVGK